jgi:hypothetical protein
LTSSVARPNRHLELQARVISGARAADTLMGVGGQ